MSVVRVLYRNNHGGWNNRYFIKVREARAWARAVQGRIAEPAVPANHEGTSVPLSRPVKALNKRLPRR
jgi:hypothetical protein